jgi:hypothetical protein
MRRDVIGQVIFKDDIFDIFQTRRANNVLRRRFGLRIVVDEVHCGEINRAEVLEA